MSNRTTKKVYYALMFSTLLGLMFSFQNCASEFDAGEYASNGSTGGGNNPPPPPPPPPPADPVYKVSAGTRHSCALKDNKAYCWGQNEQGQVGNSTTTNQPTPVAVSTTVLFKQISAGFNHTCAVQNGGIEQVYCWGNNSEGQLGIGTQLTSAIPVPVSLSGVAEVSAGTYSTCARLNNGNVYCWGSDTGGLLGLAGTQTRSLTPVQVPFFNGDAIDIDSGLIFFDGITTFDPRMFAQNCAVKNTGFVYCWGYVYSSNVTGLFSNFQTPIQIVGLTNMKSVEASYQNGCALSNAGTVQCWGKAQNGLLGITGIASVFTGVAPSAVGLTNVTNLSMGQTHVCATNDVTTYCWGNTYSYVAATLTYTGQVGQMSNNVVNQSYTTPIAITMPSAAKDFSAGSVHSCFVVTTGVQCFGSNYHLQLGNVTIPRESYLPVTATF